MKHIFITFLICLPFAAFSQASDYSSLDSASKAKVDSIVARAKLIEGSASHGKMVSFTEWNIDMLSPFFDYLINTLGYTTNAGGTAKTRQLNMIKTNAGFTTQLYKYNGYSAAPASLKIAFNCKKDGSNITQVKITGAFNLLAELYLQYFEGHVAPNLPEKGGLDRLYTVTDEVRIYPTNILITPHHNNLSAE